MPRRPRFHEDSHLPAREVRDASRTLLEAALAAPTADALLRAVAAAAIDPAGLGGEVAHALRWDAVTGLFELVARTSVAPEGVIDRRPEPRLAAWELDALDSPVREAWLARRAATFARVAGANAGTPWSGASCAALPVRTRTRDLGVVVVELARDDDAADRIGMLGAWVTLAAESWEGARERARRATHAAALAELTRVALAPRNIAEVLHAAARAAAEATRSSGAGAWTVGSAGAATLQVTHGATGNRDRAARALH